MSVTPRVVAEFVVDRLMDLVEQFCHRDLGGIRQQICVAVCCSVLQGVAVCCSVLQLEAV